MRPLLSAVVLRSQSDARLVALARDGYEQAFVTIAARYRRELLAHARRAGPADRAEDIVQQALLGAWSALKRNTEVHEPRAWLHRIVHNTALRVAGTSQQHEELTDTHTATTSTDATAEVRLDAVAALEALASLPAPQRRALELTALGDLSGREAAAELGVSEGALRQLVHRARVTLRSGVAALIPGPLLTWAVGGQGDSVPARIVELSTGAGLAATAVKVCATAAVTASIVGGAAELLPGGHGRSSASRGHPASRAELTSIRARATISPPGGPIVEPAIAARVRPPHIQASQNADRHPQSATSERGSPGYGEHGALSGGEAQGGDRPGAPTPGQAPLDSHTGDGHGQGTRSPTLETSPAPTGDGQAPSDSSQPLAVGAGQADGSPRSPSS